MKRKMYKGGNSRNVPEIDVPAALNDGWTFERPSAAIAPPQEKPKPPDPEAPPEPAPRKRRSSTPSESSLLE